MIPGSLKEKEGGGVGGREINGTEPRKVKYENGCPKHYRVQFFPRGVGRCRQKRHTAESTQI